jgi:hypothetical protein
VFYYYCLSAADHFLGEQVKVPFAFRDALLKELVEAVRQHQVSDEEICTSAGLDILIHHLSPE